MRSLSQVIIGCAIPLLSCIANPLDAQTVAAVPGPTLAEAHKAISVAHAAAAKMGVNLSCAVLDSRGDLVALERMDKARFFTTDLARGKALMSATFGQPSGTMAGLANSPLFPGINTAAQGRMYPLQGAVPIIRNNATFGAIGCSGGTGQQDEDAAKSALAALP